MQVPERLALIGGSILLSSTLIFTLKSQASQILPNVGHTIENTMAGKDVQKDKQAQTDAKRKQQQDSDEAKQRDQQEQQQKDAQKKQDNYNNSFDGHFDQAQQKHWKTGHWGTAKYYIDHTSMHVGKGVLQGSYYSVVNHNNIGDISFDESVQAPQDSSKLFSDPHDGDNTKLTNVNGLNNMDTSQVTNMYGMFHNDMSVNSLDFSHWNTSKANNMSQMFTFNSALKNLDLGNFDTSNVTDMSYMFQGINAQSLDLSHFDTSHLSNASSMFYNADVHQIIVGSKANLNSSDWDSNYQNGNQISSNINDYHNHPGTWVKQ